MGRSELKKNQDGKKYKVAGVTEMIGGKLKKRRIELNFSLSDVGEMCGFSTSTIVDIEIGVTVSIDYYIAYAQTLNYRLSDLFDINIRYGPRFKLSPEKEARLFITDNIKKLYTDYDFFDSERSVDDVSIKLLQLHIIPEINPFIRTRISGTLLSLVQQEILYIARKVGRNNLYLKVKKN